MRSEADPSVEPKGPAYEGGPAVAEMFSTFPDEKIVEWFATGGPKKLGWTEEHALKAREAWSSGRAPAGPWNYGYGADNLSWMSSKAQMPDRNKNLQLLDRYLEAFTQVTGIPMRSERVKDHESGDNDGYGSVEVKIQRG